MGCSPLMSHVHVCASAPQTQDQSLSWQRKLMISIMVPTKPDWSGLDLSTGNWSCNWICSATIGTGPCNQIKTINKRQKTESRSTWGAKTQQKQSKTQTLMFGIKTCYLMWYFHMLSDEAAFTSQNRSSLRSNANSFHYRKRFLQFHNCTITSFVFFFCAACQWTRLCVVTAQSENTWWRFNTDYRTSFTNKMCMPITFD